MERKIKCDEAYNPYKILDRISNVLLDDYAFQLSIQPNTLKNTYTHIFYSGLLRIKVTNNSTHDNYFHVDIDHAEHVGPMYRRANLGLVNDYYIDDLLDKIKNVIHQYKDDLQVASHRAVMIASIID